MRKCSVLYFACLAIIILGPSSCGPANITSPKPVPTRVAPTATATPFPTAEVTFAPAVVLLRSDQQRTGVYDVLAIRDQPEVHWRARIGASLLTSPLVADGMLYVASTSGTLYALDEATGGQVWSVNGLGQLENTGAISGHMLISAGVSKQVRALHRQAGEELWAFETAYPVQGAPLIVDDRVYIATDREVYALELESGELVWSVNTGDEQAFMGAPAYKDGVIYTAAGRLLLALDSQTGEVIWRVIRENHFLGLAVANDIIYVGNRDGAFYAFDRSTGAERWKFQGNGEFWSAPAVGSETLHVGSADRLYALDTQSGEMLWSFQAGGQPVSEPLISDGVVYFSDSNHEVPRGPRRLYALDAISGERLWMFEIESTYLPAPALGSGVIYLSSTGEVIALK